MKRIQFLGLTCLLFLWGIGCLGQEKANYKAAERYLVSNAGKLVYSRDVKANYLPDSDCFWFSFQTSKGTDYYWVNPKAGKVAPLFDKEQTSVVMVKPAGTGTPIRFISARLAPLPPSRFFISALPSAFPSPNV